MISPGNPFILGSRLQNIASVGLCILVSAGFFQAVFVFKSDMVVICRLQEDSQIMSFTLSENSQLALLNIATQVDNLLTWLLISMFSTEVSGI